MLWGSGSYHLIIMYFPKQTPSSFPQNLILSAVFAICTGLWPSQHFRTTEFPLLPYPGTGPQRPGLLLTGIR